MPEVQRKKDKEKKMKREINGIKVLLNMDSVQNYVDINKMINLCDFVEKQNFKKFLIYHKNNDCLLVFRDEENNRIGLFLLTNIKIHYISMCILPVSKLDSSLLNNMVNIINESLHINNLIDIYKQEIITCRNDISKLKQTCLKLKIRLIEIKNKWIEFDHNLQLTTKK
ncbi:hypothetical protein [Photorhabdus australis]|uniref:hypothetical protein n=1 Tax=Photorhabdus australis TaxID=286156 RepID=UPI00056C1069|nr:hypothetical protein [Photorhabdus australis]